MQPAWSYHSVEEKLTRVFRDQANAGGGSDIKMVGFLFAQPNAALGKKEIVPSLDYFHHRSGSSIDFFCSGYRRYGQSVHSDERAVTKGEDPWYFSDTAFNDLRNDVADRTTWRYSGEADLVLLDADFDKRKQMATLSWDAAIMCDLDLMLRSGAITSVNRYFEVVFNFAENYEGNAPTESFSANRNLNVAGSALKRIVLSAVPGGVADDMKSLGYFSTRNLDKG